MGAAKRGLDEQLGADPGRGALRVLGLDARREGVVLRIEDSSGKVIIVYEVTIVGLEEGLACDVVVDRTSQADARRESRLGALTDEFDALLARMQEPAARGRMQEAFDADPEQLGRAAVDAARRHG